MTRLVRAIFAISLAVVPLHEASAFCMYDGKMYAKTTIRQEFRDSRWVLRVRVLSERNNGSRPAVDQGLEALWSIYRLNVTHRYKGKGPSTMTFFTERNSGAFYFDRPWKGPDIGTEYLVFLNPNEHYAGEPREARGTVFVNYSCGQSKPWREVSAGERRLLERLSVRR
jgi:hypothetical protein